jgi:hypothetical protein
MARRLAAEYAFARLPSDPAKYGPWRRGLRYVNTQACKLRLSRALRLDPGMARDSWTGLAPADGFASGLPAHIQLTGLWRRIRTDRELFWVEAV